MKKKYIIVSLISFILFSSVVSAASVSIKASNTSITRGNSVTVTATVSSDSPLVSIEGTLMCKGAGVSSGVDMAFDDSSNSVYSKSYSTTVKPSSSGTISCSVTSSRITNMASDSWQNLGDKTISIKVSEPVYIPPKTYSSNNYLKSLEIEGYTIDFNKDTNEYSIEVPNGTEKVNIKTSLEDTKAKVSGDGEVSISEGTNKLEVKVTAENGDVKDYIIKVTRDKMPDASNYLSYMAVDNFELEPEFTKKNLNYEVDVPKDTTNITLHLKADDPRYTTVSIYKLGESAMTDIDVTQKDPSINLDITSKDTTFVIRVTNYQGITRNYQLLVYRLGDDEARIKSLSFNHGELSPKFDRDKFEYTLEVDRSINAIKESVIMLAEDSTYTIIGNKNLKPGNNTVLIKTLSADKTIE